MAILLAQILGTVPLICPPNYNYMQLLFDIGIENSLDHAALCKCPFLGGGSFGAVYKVTIDGKEYAAKEFNCVYSTSEFKHRKSEFDLLPTLEHDNIVCYVGVQNCVPGQRPILIMELMHCTLHTLITQEEPNHVSVDIRNPEVKMRVALDVIHGLEYLHCEKNKPAIVHRDLTAKNVLLDSRGIAKIADFGYSRLLKHNQLSNMTRGRGTLNYMAPEVQSIHYNEKVDIFSFGHLLLFIFIDEDPANLPPATFPLDDGSIAGRTELGRRQEYIKQLVQCCDKANVQFIVKIVEECLSNLATRRPSATDILKGLQSHLS